MSSSKSKSKDKKKDNKKDKKRDKDSSSSSKEKQKFDPKSYEEVTRLTNETKSWQLKLTQSTTRHE
jgi:hypothetical protein